MNSQNDLNNILRRGYSVDIGGFLNRGWEIFQQNMGGFIGFFIIVFLINIVLSFIPGVGGLISMVISGPLQAGYFIVAFKIGKRQPVEFGTFFKGFQNSYFLSTFLVTLVTSIIFLLCMLPLIIVAVLMPLILGGAESLGGDSPLAVLGPLGGIVLLLVTLACLAAVIYVGVGYTFALPFVVGKRMQFWPAMEASRQLVNKQWLAVFVFVLVLGLVNIAGALACGVGILLSAPLTVCAVAAAYESIVGLPEFDPAEA